MPLKSNEENNDFLLLKTAQPLDPNLEPEDKNRYSIISNWIESTYPYGDPIGVQTSIDYFNPFKGKSFKPAPITQNVTERTKARRALQYLTANLPVPKEYAHTQEVIHNDNFNPLNHKKEPTTYYTPTSKEIINNVRNQTVNSPLGINYNNKLDIINKMNYYSLRMDSLVSAYKAEETTGYTLEGKETAINQSSNTANKIYEMLSLMDRPYNHGALKRNVRYEGTPYLDATAYINPENLKNRGELVPRSYMVDKWDTATKYYKPSYEPNPAISVVPINTDGKFKYLFDPEVIKTGRELGEKLKKRQIEQVKYPKPDYSKLHPRKYKDLHDGFFKTVISWDNPVWNTIYNRAGLIPWEENPTYMPVTNYKEFLGKIIKPVYERPQKFKSTDYQWTTDLYH